MSREGTRSKAQAQPAPPEKRPLLVWAIYVLGGVGAAVLALSALFTAGAAFGPSDADVAVDVSALALALWGGLVLLAVVVWLWRRRRVQP